MEQVGEAATFGLRCLKCGGRWYFHEDPLLLKESGSGERVEKRSIKRCKIHLTRTWKI